MDKLRKKQSNPFSMGQGGGNFEIHVQAAFVVLMLTGRIAPCLPPWPIIEVKLQGSYADFNTDDFIVFTEDFSTGKKAKLLSQIKHTISITESNNVFSEVIQAAWDDFNDPNIFSLEIDAIALITSSLSTTDYNNVRTILEWARHSENENEFLFKINKDNFSSDAKRAKLNAFKVQLQKANGGTELSAYQLWVFLKHYYLLGYDLDSEEGSTLSLILSLIAQSSTDDPPSIWAKIVNKVQFFDQDSGTISLETLPEEIRNSFNTKRNPHWDSDIKKLRDHGKYIIDGIRSNIGGVHIKRPNLFDHLIEISGRSEFVFILGERGSGKSALVREFAEYMDGRAPIFCLRTEDLDQAHLDNIFSTIGLTSSLSDLEAGFALMPKKYLIIESLEKLLELHNTVAFTDLIQFVHRHPGWTIIASGRDYSHQQISFNYFQPYSINYSPLVISGFSDNQVQELCEKLEPLKPLVNNLSIKQLLKNPFLADFAFSLAQTGTKFSNIDSEREFRNAVWKYIISKEQMRAEGMPLKRRQTFIDIAVRRAKLMVYGIPDRELDPDALLKLEEDNLICRDSSIGLVSPAHDVLEDWALEYYIEDIYQSNSDNIHEFLNDVGHEPAMNRAFRLWLHQKLRNGDNIKHFILSILNNKGIEICWQDETITAVLLGDNPYGFLVELKDQLFENDSELLKRFCFILRISCKIPDKDLIKQFSDKNDKELGVLSTLFLKPRGQGWDDIIHFLYENRERVSEGLLPHVSAVLDEWSNLIHIENDLPDNAREVGLLALHLLTMVKESCRDEVDRKKILTLIIKVVPAILQEFNEMLEVDLFKTNDKHRLYYLDDLVVMSLIGIETAFLCKHVPDIVIKLAWHEWLMEDLKEEQDRYRYYHIDVEEYFGLRHFGPGSNFFPASGAKGPFQYLLRYHPRKGLDFIIELLNKAAEKYAHSDLDVPERYSSLPAGIIPSGVEQVEVRLNDGTTIKQYCSERLWLGYRGHSVVPYLLQSALMVLENWLIDIVKYTKSIDAIELTFDYILRNSNSVMPTAVLASVATGFPDKLGKASLPLLRMPEIYDLDLRRTVHEMGKNEINWFYGVRDPFSDIYTKERRTAALRPWRKENMETLIVRLQFSSLNEHIFIILDELRSNVPKNEDWGFRFHRIDSRGWQPEVDQKNNRIVFTTQNLEPELEEVQKNTQEEQALIQRFNKLYLWSEKTLTKEALNGEYFHNWNDALTDTKILFEILKSKAASDLVGMFYGSIIKAAVVFLLNYSNEMDEDDISWCIELIIQAVLANADTMESIAIVDITDHDGAATSASILPIILDFATEDEEKLLVKRIIAIALTHSNENVRSEAANGIREYLWQRDPDFAQKCIMGTIEYARLKSNINYEKRKISTQLEDSKQKNSDGNSDPNEWLYHFREQLSQGVVKTDLEQISFRSHSSRHLLTPLLMIPNGSTESIHIFILSRILTLIFKSEELGNIHNNKKEEAMEIPYELSSKLSRLFADYLLEVSDSNVQQIFIEQLKVGCVDSPNFINSMLLNIQMSLEKIGKKDRYWWFWNQLSEQVQTIAKHITKEKSRHNKNYDKIKLIRMMLYADITWQQVNYEYDNIAFGKDFINKFVVNAGTNSDVFEAMASLMFHFPTIFLESGLLILSKHQKDAGGTYLLSRNASFYLERSISRFLLVDHMAPLSKNQYQSCKILLDAAVETGSSGAYYLREHLIRYSRIVNQGLGYEKRINHMERV